MFPRATSIRGKIATGYVLSFLLLLLVASVLFASLHVAEDEVEFYFGASRFLDTALEMRRYEKNYLLYGQREDLEAALRFADSGGALVAAQARASRHPRWLRLFADVDREPGPEEASPERTAALLGEYAALLRTAAAWRAGDRPRPAPALEADIRELGRRITGIAVLVGDEFVYFGGSGPPVPATLTGADGRSLCKTGIGYQAFDDQAFIHRVKAWLHTLGLNGYQGAPFEWISLRD